MFLPVEWVNRRQRQILVHSFLYYQLNTNILPDHTYDLWCKELAAYMQQHPEIAVKSVYYEAFKNFDGSSGYDLPYGNPEIQNVGYRLLKLEKRK
jgi:NAD-dependent DNA ligase adenylation domain